MMRKLSLLLFAAVCMSVAASAQLCGFDKVHRAMMGSSPVYAQRVQQMDSDLAAMINANANSLIVNGPSGPVYEIPVVIHVMHTGGALGTPYNPTDAQLTAMITYLNTTYAAGSNIYGYPVAGSGGTYFPVRFALAQRDLNCNPTTGIEHVPVQSLLNAYYGPTTGPAVFTRYSNSGIRDVYSSYIQAVREDTIKALATWDPNDFYNIWVVNKIEGKDGTGSGSYTAGYAYFPGAYVVPSQGGLTYQPLDGTIMLAHNSLAGEQTLPHEIGHAFSLYHVFEGDDPGNTGAATTCPSNAVCTVDGDKVCDTEPTKRNLGACPTTNSCTGLPYTNATQHNFMDYSTCQDRFTPGQQTRWLNTLTSTRYSLVTSLGTTGSSVALSSGCTPSIASVTAFNTFNMGPRKVVVSNASGVLMDGTSTGGFTVDGYRAYIDRSCQQRANLTAGQVYTISVTTGQNNPENVRVYIDYNNDGSFTSSVSELVYTHNGTLNNETHTGTFTVPTASVATCTTLRMRVVSDFASSAAPGPCSVLDYGQGEDYSVFIKPVAPSTVSVSLTSGSNPSCGGTTLGFTGNYTGTPGSPAVHIYVNGVIKSLTNTYSSSTFNNGDIVTAVLVYTGTCGTDSITSAGYTITRSTVVTPTVTLAVTTGTNPGCAGQSITLTATPTNGGTAPTYQFYVNSLAATGTSSANTYTFTPACGDNVQAKLNSNSTCASTTSVTSNTVSYTCGPQAISVSTAITAGSNPTCSGRSVSFAATPVNGGTAPTYQWYVNGVAVSGATAASFTSNTLNNGDSVTVKLTSSSPCAATPFAFSPAIYMIVVPTVTPGVKLSITAGTNPGCIGDVIQLTGVTTNAGATPTYRWYYNGALTFFTGATYTTATSVTGDKLYVRIIGANPAASCYTRDTAYSDTITLDRRPVPSVPVISFIGHQLISDSTNVQWWGPAGILPGATGPVYTPTVQGDYYAVVNSPLCGTGKSNVLTISPLTIGNYNMSGVRLYPNPTTGLLTITWSAPVNNRITVYSATGKALLRDEAAGVARKALDLATLPSGIYFVQLQDEKGNSGAVRVTVTH